MGTDRLKDDDDGVTVEATTSAGAEPTAAAADGNLVAAQDAQPSPGPVPVLPFEPPPDSDPPPADAVVLGMRWFLAIPLVVLALVLAASVVGDHYGTQATQREEQLRNAKIRANHEAMLESDRRAREGSQVQKGEAEAGRRANDGSRRPDGENAGSR